MPRRKEDTRPLEEAIDTKINSYLQYAIDTITKLVIYEIVSAGRAIKEQDIRTLIEQKTKNMRIVTPELKNIVFDIVKSKRTVENLLNKKPRLSNLHELFWN